MQNILVVKLSAIGDVIHALPVSYAIKESFPDAHLTWVVEPPAYDLLTMDSCVDEIITFHKKEFKSVGGFQHLPTCFIGYQVRTRESSRHRGNGDA